MVRVHNSGPVFSSATHSQRAPLRGRAWIHSGDNIYADGPIAAERPTESGRIWKNIVTPEVSKVAETLNEFRGRYRHNMMDENVRRCNGEVPQIWQRDDREVTYNGSGSKDLSANARYTEKTPRPPKATKPVTWVQRKLRG